MQGQIAVSKSNIPSESTGIRNLEFPQFPAAPLLLTVLGMGAFPSGPHSGISPLRRELYAGGVSNYCSWELLHVLQVGNNGILFPKTWGCHITS